MQDGKTSVGVVSRPSAERVTVKRRPLFTVIQGKGLVEERRFVTREEEELNRRLILATAKKEIGKVKELLDKGANVNASDEDGWTPLMWASNRGYNELVGFLLNRGADIHARDNMDWSSIMHASAEGEAETVKLLLERGANANDESCFGYSALSIAFQWRHTEVIGVMIEHLQKSNIL